MITEKEIFDGGTCDICDKEGQVLHIPFSFCYEYSCGIHMCKKCLRELGKEFNK